jgi:long-chain acyl-CoA synthetase
MPIGYRRAELKYKKQKPGLFERLLIFIADIILFRPIRSSLGLNNAIVCYSTDAIISPDACRFYHALNVPLKSVYSTTEGGVLAGAYNDDIHADSVGHVHRGTDIKITDDGELICKQEGIFLGYYKDPEKTKEVLKDGWFYSGDCCSIRDDGHVVFVEKLDDILELSTGHKIAPQSIESKLRFSPYIMDAWIVAGSDKNFASAVIIINYNNVSRWAGQNRIGFTGFAELSQKPEVYELIKENIKRVNNSLDEQTRIKKFINLHRTFNPDEAEMTRNRKLRRKFLDKRYRNIINAIYTNKTEVPINTDITKNGTTITLKTNLYIKNVT